MFDNRLAVAVLGGACVLAASTGAFVATRMNPGPAETDVARPAESAPAPAPVHETEALVEAPAVEAVPPRVAPVPEREQPAPAPRRVERPRPVARAEAGPQRRTQPSTPRPEPPPPAPAAAAEPVAPESLPSQRPVEPMEPPAPVRPVYEELVIASDSVIGLRIENTVTSETAELEDQVEARVTRDVMVGDRVALPTGSRALGHVTAIERGGKVKERARLGVRFHTLVLADGTTLPMQTETVFREGDSPTRASTAKIGGGAIGGAVIGAILGGARGAVIGGSAGAAGGTAAVMAGSRKPATLQSGTTLTVRVLSPVTVTVEQ
jgi:hypothetical protein